MLFDAIAIQVDGPRAWDERLSIDVSFTEPPARYRLTLANGVLTYSTDGRHGDADVTLSLPRSSLPVLAAGGITAEALAAAGIEVTGDAAVLQRLVSVLEPGDEDFAIVTAEREQ